MRRHLSCFKELASAGKAIKEYYVAIVSKTIPGIKRFECEKCPGQKENITILVILTVVVILVLFFLVK